MEPSGEINVLQTRENLPLTPKDLGIQVAPEKPGQVVVMDGEVMDEPRASQASIRDGWWKNWTSRALRSRMYFSPR